MVRRSSRSGPGEQQRAATPAADVIAALSGALGSSYPSGGLVVHHQRLAGRSSIFVVGSGEATGGTGRWVVKRPHTEWSQDDVGSPVTAEEEFAALQRLHRHFADLGLPFGVPAPAFYLPELEAFVMEHVEGPTVKQLLDYRTLARPSKLLDGLAASGTFLRHLHSLDPRPLIEIDCRQQAARTLLVAEDKLHPIGLTLPEPVQRTLSEMPGLVLTSPRVLLHGDFGPANVILADQGRTVGLDSSLTHWGLPEEDLARYVALVAGIIRLAPGVVVPPVADLRRRLEQRVLSGYYGDDVRPLLFELTYLHQLVRRWCRLRELAQRHARRATVRPKLMVIDGQVRSLLLESARRVATHVEAA